jgi:hypothetical protein
LVPQQNPPATAEISVPSQNWPATIDRSSLRFFATQASHVLLGTVTEVVTDAQVSDFFFDFNWKIHYDYATVSVEQSVGESVPGGDIVLRLHPTRCEAYDGDKPVTATLSICQMRQPYNTLREGERVLVFLRGRMDGTQPPLVDLKFPVRDAGFRLVRGDVATTVTPVTMTPATPTLAATVTPR